MHRNDTFLFGLTTHRYMVGVFDKSTNELTLRHAPLYVVRHQVKALKSLAPIGESKHDDSWEGRIRARNVLGEEFGTKKAKARIRAAERNKVDAKAVKDVCTFDVPHFLIPTIFSGGRRHSPEHYPIKDGHTSESGRSQSGSR
jgi:hypothetical protein